jgi:hypothetical protein
MLKDFAEAAVRLARNPLGIIGLAFVLVYGIAGVVATSAVFGPQERLVLVWFLVGFPVLILGAFYRLVTKHHSKLYAPSDFKEDASFPQALDARISSSPKVLELEEITKQIQREIHNQPLYKYTKLSECGKQLILGLNQSNRLVMPAYNEKRGFSTEDLDVQAKLLVEFGWAARKGDELILTPRGRADIDTFIDLAYGRMA